MNSGTNEKEKNINIKNKRYKTAKNYSNAQKVFNKCRRENNDWLSVSEYARPGKQLGNPC